MTKRLLIIAAFLLAACAAPYALPANDRADIAKRITSFERAFLAGQTNQIINVIPPRLITAIATTEGVPEKALRREMAKATREATRKVKVVSFGMALDQAKFLTTPSGRPYGLIPTQTVVQIPGSTSKLQSNNTTLTLEDGGKWYLMRIDEGRQIELLRNAYPDFKGVTLPKGTTKVIG